jgi:hypothetical protein
MQLPMRRMLAPGKLLCTGVLAGFAGCVAPPGLFICVCVPTVSTVGYVVSSLRTMLEFDFLGGPLFRAVCERVGYFSILFGRLTSGIARGQTEGVADRDFAGLEALDGQVLDFEGF